jgi:putative nucleotidyltransferase with HDIG domain
VTTLHPLRNNRSAMLEKSSLKNKQSLPIYPLEFIGFHLYLCDLMDTDYIQVKSSHLDLYRKVPFYFENSQGEFALYKPVDVTLSEMRIRERLHPEKLYIKRKNKIEAIQEVQTEYNREIKRCIKENDLVKVRDVVQSIVQTTLDEPVTGSLEGISTTVNILVGEVAKNRDIVKVLFDLTSKDYTTTIHSVNVMALALGYANHVNFEKQKKKILGISALLHDVGKARINTEILTSPHKLTDNEFHEIKKHTTKGFNILGTCKFSNSEIKTTALEHHEKLDGSGYPDQKTDISEFAQIVAIIDCYEALTNDERVYRKASDPLSALKIIQTEIVDAGKFSPNIFRNFAYSLLKIYSPK